MLTYSDHRGLYVYYFVFMDYKSFRQDFDPEMPPATTKYRSDQRHSEVGWVWFLEVDAKSKTIGWLGYRNIWSQGRKQLFSTRTAYIKRLQLLVLVHGTDISTFA